MVSALVLNFGTGRSIPPEDPTFGTDNITYGNFNDPFANWFLGKFFDSIFFDTKGCSNVFLFNHPRFVYKV